MIYERYFRTFSTLWFEKYKLHRNFCIYRLHRFQMYISIAEFFGWMGFNNLPGPNSFKLKKCAWNIIMLPLILMHSSSLYFFFCKIVYRYQIMFSKVSINIFGLFNRWFGDIASPLQQKVWKRTIACITNILQNHAVKQALPNICHKRGNTLKSIKLPKMQPRVGFPPIS